MAGIIGRAKRAPHCDCSIENRVIYVYIYMYVGLSMGNPYKKYVCQKCVGRIMWPKNMHAQSQFGAVNRPMTPILFITRARKRAG